MNYQNQHHRLLNQRTIDSNIEQLVRESPIPQALFHNSSIEPDGHHGRFQMSSRAGKPMFSSAVAKCHSFTSPQAQFAPFRSPQSINHSNSLAASIFKSLKDHVSLDTDHLSLDSSSDQDQSKHENLSLSSTSKCHNGSFQPSHQRAPLQNIAQNRSAHYTTNYQHMHLSDNSVHINPGLKLTTSSSVLQDDPKTNHVISRQSVEYGIPTTVAAGLNNVYEETFHDAFTSTKNLKDDSVLCNQEPCSLYMWIIKPVPGANKICVEGKKCLTDENFWHSGEITRRLDDKLVATQNRSVYKLEGNMEILDAMAAGFSRKTAYAFWLGFPADWAKLIDDHFKAVALNSIEEKVSDSEEEITVIEGDNEVHVEEVVEGKHDSSELAAREDDVVCQEEHDTNDSEKEIVVEPRKKKKFDSSTTKHVVLENWIIKPLPNRKGINVIGTKQSGLLWHSSAIEQRLDKRHLLSSSGATYKLKGRLDRLIALNEGLPLTIINKFLNGFPKEWQELIQEYLYDEKAKKKKLSKQQKSKNDKKMIRRSKETKDDLKNKNSAKKPDSEDVKVNRTERSSSKNVEKKSNSSTKSEKKTGTDKKANPIKTPVAVDLHETSKTVITPRGEVVDLESLGRSRSGRLIKPPLQWWTGQTLECQGDSVSVKAPTIASSQFVRNFEQEYERATHKLKPYWNPREKDKDYSLNSSRNSSLTRNISLGDAEVNKKSSHKSGRSGFASDNNVDDKLEFEVKIILEKAKTNRKPRGRRETCYKQVNTEMVDDTEDSPYELNGSSDCDGGSETVNKKTSNHVVIKTSKVRRQEQMNRNVDQENVVSSSTGDINQDVNETVADGDRNVRNLRSKRSKTTDTSVVLNKKPTRQSRRNTLSVILEDDKIEEQNSEPKPVNERLTRKRPLKKVENTNESVLNNDVVDDHWTKEEKDKLTEACKTVSITHPHYWENVADMVRTKTADSCKDFYYQNEKPAKSVERKKKVSTKEKQKVTAITANVGTLKRKQQLRDILDQQNENYSDDLFDSTPFRVTRKRKIPKLGDIDDDAIFEELAKKQGKSRFETPVASGMMTSRISVPFASSKKTPKSSINIEEEGKSPVMDGYVHNMMKRRLLSKGRKKSKETPKLKKTVPDVEISPKQKLLFNKYISETKDNEENYVDSDQEEDYYWEDEQT